MSNGTTYYNGYKIMKELKPQTRVIALQNNNIAIDTKIIACIYSRFPYRLINYEIKTIVGNEIIEPDKIISYKTHLGWKINIPKVV